MLSTDMNSQRFYHGTKADLEPGDLIQPGYGSNYGTRKRAAWVYLTATLDAAIWGAELAVGEGPRAGILASALRFRMRMARLKGRSFRRRLRTKS